MTEINREQLATVLDQIADYSSPDDIRAHLRIVTGALRGSDLVIMNGPPQHPAPEFPPGSDSPVIRISSQLPSQQSPREAP